LRAHCGFCFLLLTYFFFFQTLSRFWASLQIFLSSLHSLFHFSRLSDARSSRRSKRCCAWHVRRPSRGQRRRENASGVFFALSFFFSCVYLFFSSSLFLVADCSCVISFLTSVSHV
jgi:hypothetical protein